MISIKKITVYEYYFWRGLYITIKPLALIISTNLNGEGFSNLLAIAILISGTLMASLSMGSYRNLFKFKDDKTKFNYANNTRKSIFKINTALVIVISLFTSLFYSLDICLFIAFFVLTEHVIHDESRLKLYSGNRKDWAKYNSLRTLFIPLIPILLYFSNDWVSYLYIVIFLFFINALLSYSQKGLFQANKGSIYLLTKKNFYLNYKKQFNYLLSATTNRAIQQSDKFLFSIISYELLWLYTLLCQMLNIPLVMFEMVFMSELKAKITKVKRHSFTWLKAVQLKALTIVTLMSILAFCIASYHIRDLLEPQFIFMGIVICFANFLSALSMQNSEKLFWHLGDAKKYGRLEMTALLIGHLLFVPLVLILGNFMFVKLPNIISILVKLRNSKKWLAN